MICSCALNFSRCKITAFLFHKMKAIAKLCKKNDIRKFFRQEMQMKCILQAKIKK